MVANNVADNIFDIFGSSMSDLESKFFSRTKNAKSNPQSKNKTQDLNAILDVFNEDLQGDWINGAYRGGGWKYVGAWVTSDPLAGSTAIGLMCLIIKQNPKDCLILIRRSNPDMPQLWYR